MVESEGGLTLEDLVQKTGVPARTIRYYITTRLLPGPATRGKGASYTEEHLVRLRLIRRLSERHLPLIEIRQRLAQLSSTESRALLAEEERQEAELKRIDADNSLSPKAYLAAVLGQAQAARRAARPEQPPAQGPAPGMQAPMPAQSPGRMLDQSPEQDSFPPSPAPGYGGVVDQQVRTWQRWELAPGLELHVRADMEPLYRARIARLLATRSRKTTWIVEHSTYWDAFNGVEEQADEHAERHRSEWSGIHSGTRLRVFLAGAP